jgi:hypothetical protein
LNGETSVRFALALPVASRSSIAAATGVAINFVRRYGRIELDLIESPPDLRQPVAGAGVLATVLLSVNVWLRPSTAETRGEVERRLRQQVERQYARQGISSVLYDLQIL